VLIGLNPVTTQLFLLDGMDGFQGDGPAVPLLIAPRGGSNIVSGIGISAGVANPRAAGILWMASSSSLLDDVSFFPGHTRYIAALSPGRPAPAPLPRGSYDKYFDTEHPDLWVKDGGGGVFRGLWTHGSFSKAGLRVENTETESSVYQLSCEHHLHTETEFHHVQNWKIYAMQTEEENPAGADAIAAEIEESQHLTFANTYVYRVSRNVMPKLHAVTVHNSDDVQFENVKVFSQTRLAFDNSVFDEDNGVTVRPHDFAKFTVHQGTKAPAPLAIPPRIFVKDAKLEKLASGFSNASGLTVDKDGHVYFTDAAMHKVYRWNEDAKRAEVIAEIPGSPMALGFANPDTLLIMAYEKAVYSLDLSLPGAKAQPVAETASLAPDTTLLLPGGLHNELWNLEWLVEHRGYVFRPGSNTAILNNVEDEHRGYFYAPGTTTAMMGGGTWLLRDEAGNVYMASGQVYIYNASGQQIGVVEIPERPSSLALGGADHHTMFIGARGSLYSIRLASARK